MSAMGRKRTLFTSLFRFDQVRLFLELSGEAEQFAAYFVDARLC